MSAIPLWVAGLVFCSLSIGEIRIPRTTGGIVPRSCRTCHCTGHFEASPGWFRGRSCLLRVSTVLWRWWQPCSVLWLRREGCFPWTGILCCIWTRIAVAPQCSGENVRCWPSFWLFSRTFSKSPCMCLRPSQFLPSGRSNDAWKTCRRKHPFPWEVIKGWWIHRQRYMTVQHQVGTFGSQYINLPGGVVWGWMSCTAVRTNALTLARAVHSRDFCFDPFLRFFLGGGASSSDSLSELLSKLCCFFLFFALLLCVGGLRRGGASSLLLSELWTFGRCLLDVFIACCFFDLRLPFRESSNSSSWVSSS